MRTSITLSVLFAAATVGVHEAEAGSDVPLDRVGRALALECEREDGTHRHILTGHGHRVVLCPGFRHALVNGRVVCMDAPVRFSAGEMSVPRAFYDWLRRELPPSPPPRDTPSPRPAVPTAPSRRLRIMIDPGHGGGDPGATRGRLTEKAVNLDIALRLKRLLEQAGYEVLMTRTTDVFVPLDDRVAQTSRARADVFLSIHANAALGRSASGFETIYVGTEGNTQREGLTHLAAAFDAASFGTPGGGDALLKTILVRALYEDRRRQSRRLADCVQQGLATHLTAQDRGAKQDSRGLRVLRGVTCPRALVEVGFLSNDHERRLLALAWYRERVARGLASGLIQFVAAQQRW